MLSKVILGLLLVSIIVHLASCYPMSGASADVDDSFRRMLRIIPRQKSVRTRLNKEIYKKITSIRLVLIFIFNFQVNAAALFRSKIEANPQREERLKRSEQIAIGKFYSNFVPRLKLFFA